MKISWFIIEKICIWNKISKERSRNSKINSKKKQKQFVTFILLELAVDDDCMLASMRLVDIFDLFVAVVFVVNELDAAATAAAEAGGAVVITTNKS